MNIVLKLNEVVTYSGPAFVEEMPDYAEPGAVTLRDDPTLSSVYYPYGPDNVEVIRA